MFYFAVSVVSRSCYMSDCDFNVPLGLQVFCWWPDPDTHCCSAWPFLLFLVLICSTSAFWLCVHSLLFVQGVLLSSGLIIKFCFWTKLLVTCCSSSAVNSKVCFLVLGHNCLQHGCFVVHCLWVVVNCCFFFLASKTLSEQFETFAC